MRFLYGFYKDFSRIGDGFDAVHQKIEDDLLKLDPVSHDNRKGSGRQSEFDRACLDVMSDEQHCFLDDIVKIQRDPVGHVFCGCAANALHNFARSEEHTSELQSLMRTSYAVFCLKTKTT